MIVAMTEKLEHFKFRAIHFDLTALPLAVVVAFYHFEMGNYVTDF